MSYMNVCMYVCMYVFMYVCIFVFIRAKKRFAEFDTDKSGFLEAKEIDAVIDWTLQVCINSRICDIYIHSCVCVCMFIHAYF
jgi:hypothetical protein